MPADEVASVPHPGPAPARRGTAQPAPPATGGPAEARWLLLIHRLPPKPAYRRGKIRRKLQRLGAVALKNSVYVLPKTDATTEDFNWLLGQIAAESGDAVLCEASLVGGGTD